MSGQESIFNHLNESQKMAITHTDGPMMILAGAGSGKTRTLVSKMTYLLDDKKLSSYQLLAMTFSNKAAKEMRQRVALDLGVEVGGLQITTFHSFCAHVLRTESSYLGLGKNFSIYDDSESKAVIKAILGRRGIAPRDINPLEVKFYIEELKNLGHYLGGPILQEYSERFQINDEFYSFFSDYEREIHTANAVDFSGLITGVLQLFIKHPNVLERYQERYRYILVDEYQDTNRAQFDLLSMLCGKHKNICVVGDEDQSIYSWRGADIRNILDFEKVYPNAKILKLEQNYRSSKIIIEAAGHVIAKNQLRKGKTMWTNNQEGEKVQIIEVGDDRDEAEFVANSITLLKTEGESLNDISIFYRTNAQSRIIEDQLRKLSIPYRIIGGIKFYDRKEVKDLISYLRLVVNPKDSLALSRIINMPARGIGATTLKKLEEEAINQGLSLWEAMVLVVENLSDYSHIRLSAKVKSSLSEFISLIQECMNWDRCGETPSAIYEKILHESGYHQILQFSKDYESKARLENLEELMTGITQYETTTSDASLSKYLETITLDQSSNDSDDKNTEEVSLMTVHGAKGLEFPYVFVMGAEESVFPSFQSLESGERAIEEERRLFYVAMTRAMKRLTICFAQTRMIFGQLRFNGPSRFLMEIPSGYYDWKKLVKGKRKEQDDSFEFSQEYFNDDLPVYEVQSDRIASKSKFQKGRAVVHGLYGEGQVLTVEGSGNDEKIVIRFRDGARKKFMVKFAPLTIV